MIFVPCLILPCLVVSATVGEFSWTPLSRSRAYAAWVILCLVWGTTYLAIRVALDSIPPLLMAGIRWIVAGGLLIAFFRLRGHALPERRQWPSLAVRGVLLIGFGNGAVVWAEQTVPSGLAAVLVALSPFWMVGIDALLGDGKMPTVRQIVGLCVGFLGIVLLVSPNLTTGAPGFGSGVIATQLACAGWALGSTYARRRAQRRQDQHTVASVAFEMLLGGIALLLCALLLQERPGVVTPRSAGAVLYLILFGSILAYSCYRYALQHLPVATLSLYVYANTVIAVFLGTLVLGEPLNWWMGTGAAVVLVGIGLVKETG
jgi:drug/metabolite transporter (DMT)-like permease